MSGKSQYPCVFNWQSTNPVTGFLPTPNQFGSIPSGVVSGTMSSTNTIYTQIVDKSKMDNVGVEVTWTGTPTGTLSVLASNSGINFYSLTFSPDIGQPAGSAGGYLIDLNQMPFKYFMFKYVNASGSGAITIYTQLQDLN